MISIQIILAMLVFHWIADFVCQSNYMAINKSKSWTALLVHTGTYTVVTGLLWLTYSALAIVYVDSRFLLALLVTFLAHTATDAVTSRITSYLWVKKQRWLFFVTIGADQILHYTQLLLTYIWLYQ